MFNPSIKKSLLKKIFRSFLIFLMVAVWIFSGWPRIWQNPQFPPKIQKVLANTTGEVYPTLGESVSEAPWSDNAWTTPTNIYSDDGNTANITSPTFDTDDQTYVLKATGFDFSAIPDNSTINGVTVRLNAWYRSGQGSGSVDLCQLLDTAKAKVGTNQCATAVALTTTDTIIITKGSASDLWGNALTAAWVKDANFGVAIGILATAINADVDVDYVTIEIDYTPPAAQITLGTGTDPASATVAPESGIRDAGAFTFQTSAGTDSVIAATVILAGAGTPYEGLSEVRITSDDGTTLYFAAISNPATNTLNFSGGTPIPASTTLTQFKIRVTPKTHANMPVPPGAEYNLSPYVSAFTSTNTQDGSDSNANTLTIDNLSPNGATLVSGSAGDQNVTLNWTTSNSADFNTTNGSVIYRWTGASAGSEVPAEGSTPTIGSVNGTATVACVVSSAASTALTRIDGLGGSADCTTVALTNGQDYTYKVFQKDTSSNYDVGVLIGTFTPQSAVPNITVGTEGTQNSPLIIPSTNNNVGGAFTFVRSSGTADVTSIVITDNGTVNANLNLSNVVLFYKTEATCSTSIPVDATQYNSTGVGFNASEKATVVGDSGMTVGTSQICVYVRLDVGSGAGDGQTMEIRIADPSTEVTVSAGTVSPATPVDIAGTTTLGVPAITVGTTGTQTGTMIIPSQDNNVGGAFTFVRNTGTANVTQIVISDLDGTVNANLNLSDVVVFYKQEVSCSASIPGDATQWNTAGVGFDASENATVIGDSAMVVGTSQICVYVRLDVGSGVGGGETLEIEITDPSTEVTVSAGVVKPATAVAIAGTTTFQAPTYISYGIPFFYDSINWGTDGSGVTFYYEVYMRATAGTVYARLYDETVGAGVADSVLSTADASFTRLKTIGLTMTNGNTYRAQFGKIGADAGETLGGKLVVNQDSVHKENTTRIALAKPESTKTSLVYSDSSEPIKVNLAHSAGMLASVSASSPPPQKSFFSKIIDKFMELTSRTIIIDNTQ